MLKDLTWNGITYKWDDGSAERIEPNTLKVYFTRDCFDAALQEYPSVTKIVINIPATIVFWDDGTKTVVKCRDGEDFDPEKGVAMAIVKKFLPKQYGRKLTAITNKALSKCEDALHKRVAANFKKRNRKKETKENHCCWNCKYKALSFWDIPCRNCRTERDKSEWAPEEK